MSKETVIKIANALVVKAETKYLNDLINESEKALQEGRETEQGMLLAEMVEEGDRLREDPLQNYDEEEYIIGKLVKKK